MGVDWKNLFRYRSPMLQTCLASLCLGLTAGIYVALSALGAGGGQPTSQHMIDIAQACLDGAAVLVGVFAGVLLNKWGPAVCTSIGAVGYPLYVGGYWYFGENGRLPFPIIGATILGLTCTLIEASAAYIAISYSEERYKGIYTCMMQVVLYMCSLFASTIPLAIDANSPDTDKVPTAVYATFVVLMASAVVLALFILPADKVRRDDGTKVAVMPKMTFKEAFQGSLVAFKDWRLLLLVPAMMSTEIHLVYIGVANGWHNNSRTRSLNSFCSLVVAIPLNLFLGWLLDRKTWSRKTRAYVGTCFVGVFLIGAYIAEVVRTRDWDRHSKGPNMDWNSPDFAGQFILFMISWNSSGLVLNLVTWYLGAMSNDPVVCAHYSGLCRAFLGVGQGMVFGIDAAGVPFMNEAGAMLALMASSILGMLVFAWKCMEETRYFKEDHVVVPFYAQEEFGHQVPEKVGGSESDTDGGATNEKVVATSTAEIGV